MNQWTTGLVDVLGYAAAALVLMAFSLRSLVALRAVAIGSNLMFIAYAYGAHLHPVLVLHAALLPVNLWRLWQCAARPAHDPIGDAPSAVSTTSPPADRSRSKGAAA
jgi:hypothetical protein